MNQVALCFAKTPGLTPAKTRLAAEIGTNLTEQLYPLMIGRCLELMKEFREFQPFIAVNEAEGVTSQIWQGLPTYLQVTGSLGKKLLEAEQFFLRSYQSICFWGTDSPSITLKHFKEVDHALKSHSTVIIPANDGGFVLYASRRPLSEGAWESVQYSKSDTLDQLRRFLPTDTFFLPALSDLDTKSDIESVLHEMLENQDQGRFWCLLKDFLQGL
jgi:glycosyltransferase A (GT-A) superfamily protein (DUF2064 family)